MNTVEIATDDYITILEDRREFIKKNYDWNIPDPIWEFVIEMIEDGTFCPKPEHASPSYVVDNIAVNGDYGVIEDFGVLDSLTEYAKEEYLAIYGKYLTEDELKEYVNDTVGVWMEWVNDNDKEMMFAYLEDESNYGIGVCYSL
jgi:hypothetical protein